MVKKPLPPHPSDHASPSWIQHRWIRRCVVVFFACLPMLLLMGDSLARKSRPIISTDVTQGLTSNPLQLMALLGSMALLPFLLMMVTSFVKIAVVLSIIRSALGTQQNPPTQVITGLAIILTVYVMTPVGLEVHGNLKPLLQEWRDSGGGSSRNNMFDPRMISLVDRVLNAGSRPIKRFLRDHSHPKERNLFFGLAQQLQRSQELKQQYDLKKSGSTNTVQPRVIGMDDFLVLVPSFVISELKEAFQIGFLIFLPFIVVDMVVANILLALGMHMLSPTTISLPFKLLLFVLVDGWYLITKGLILGYV